jgi:hypothetical protein
MEHGMPLVLFLAAVAGEYLVEMQEIKEEEKEENKKVFLIK